MKVEVTNMELKESQNHEPMVSATFVSETGKETVFNQIITHGFQIHIVNEFLRQFDTRLELKFETYKQYSELIDKVFALTAGREYELTIHTGKGDFYTYEVQAA